MRLHTGIKDHENSFQLLLAHKHIGSSLAGICMGHHLSPGLDYHVQYLTVGSNIIRGHGRSEVA